MGSQSQTRVNDFHFTSHIYLFKSFSSLFTQNRDYYYMIHFPFKVCKVLLHGRSGNSCTNPWLFYPSMRAWLGMRSRVWARGGARGYNITWATIYGCLQGSPNPATDLMLLIKDLKFGEMGTWKLFLLACEFITWLVDTLLICLKVGAHQQLTSSQKWDQIMEEDKNQKTWFKRGVFDNSNPPSGFNCLPVCLPILVVLQSVCSHGLFMVMKHWCWDGC